MCVKRARSALFVVVFVSVACGRTGLWHFADEEGEGGRGGGTMEPPMDECLVDTDCPPSGDLCAPLRGDSGGRVRECVVVAIDCDDGDVCTTDECRPDTGLCVHQAPFDGDGDGFIGTAPRGAPDFCGGDDCNDADPEIHPLALETCDGADQNCNGVIDDGAMYAPDRVTVRLAPDVPLSGRGGLAFGDGLFGATYVDKTDPAHTTSYFVLIDEDGNHLSEPAAVSLINAATFAGTIAFSGENYLTAWADARQGGGYEIYATRFNTNGEELQRDLRLTNAPDFSLRPMIQWTGSEYIVVWEDYRTDDEDRIVRLFGRRVSKGGALLGDEVMLTPRGRPGEYPAFALGDQGMGLAYVELDPVTDIPRIMFRRVDFSLETSSDPVDVGGVGQEPNIVWMGDRYLLAWQTGDTTAWGNEVMAATVDEQSQVMRVAQVTSGDAFVRWRTLVSLGDRAVLVWSGAGFDGRYDLFYEVLDRDLNVIQPRGQLTATGGMSTKPLAAVGANGDIAVIFDESELPAMDAYFVRLRCQMFGLR